MSPAHAELVGRRVGRVGFGAMQLPGPGVFGPPRDRGEALAVLARAVELGVNHIDTAQYYGPDVSNELIHAALHPYPDDLVLVSKVGGERDATGGWVAAQRPADLRRGVEDNLRSLEVDRVDVVNLRLMGDHAAPGDEVVARHVTDDPVVRTVAERLGATPAQVGLAWLLRHADNIILIPGTSSVAHLEENVAAGELQLDPEATCALADLGRRAA